MNRLKLYYTLLNKPTHIKKNKSTAYIAKPVTNMTQIVLIGQNLTNS